MLCWCFKYFRGHGRLDIKTNATVNDIVNCAYCSEVFYVDANAIIFCIRKFYAKVDKARWLAFHSH